jgi:hypothetical protein
MTKNLNKIQQNFFKTFLDKKLQFNYSLAFIKDVQVTGEAFSPQNRTSRTSKDDICQLFLFFWVIFALLDPDCESGSGSRDPNESGSNLDPDPQHCNEQ